MIARVHLLLGLTTNDHCGAPTWRLQSFANLPQERVLQGSGKAAHKHTQDPTDNGFQNPALTVPQNEISCLRGICGPPCQHVGPSLRHSCMLLAWSPQNAGPVILVSIYALFVALVEYTTILE